MNRTALPAILIVGALVVPPLEARSQVEFRQYNLIRNPSFGAADYGWQFEGLFVRRTEAAAFDAGGVGVDLNPESFDSALGSIAQTVPFLPGFTSAALTFRYRFYGTAQQQQFGEFGVGLLDRPDPVNGAPIVVFEQTADPSNLPVLDWAEFRYELTASDLQALRAHLDGGGTVSLVIYLLGRGVALHIDEVELTVDAAVPAPAASGTLAFIREGDAGGRSIHLADADGGNRRVLFDPPGQTDRIYDLAWRPGGGELAFTSDHEADFSPYSQDVFAIRPDGSGLRRVTNYPSVRELPAGTPTGTVTGRVRNDYLEPVTLFIYIEGAPALQPVTVGVNGAEEFTIPGVADFGPGVTQAVSLAYGANYREFPPVLLDVIPGETADIGEIQFLNQRFRFDPFHLSWDAAGERIAFDMGGLSRIIDAFPTAPAGPAAGEDLLGGGPASDPELSPVDGRILYSHSLDLRLYDPADGSSAALIEGELTNGHAWLPDGSGIVYSDAEGAASNLALFDPVSRRTAQLTFLTNEIASQPSPSWPDARYMAFCRTSTDYSIQDIWIMETAKPGYMWPLTMDGNSYNPRWSPGDPAPETNVGDWNKHR